MQQQQRAVDVQKAIEENLDILPKMLTTTEKEILTILLKSSHPLNTFQIRTVFSTWKLLKTYDLVFKDSTASAGIKSLREYIEKKKTVIPSSNPTDREIKQLLDFVGERQSAFKKEFEKRFPNVFLIPSYDKLENDLASLEIMGLISKREDKLKNAKYLWFINSTFYSSWLNKKRGVLKETKENGIKFVEELYSPDILDFYMITEERKNKIENKILRYYLARDNEKTGKDKDLDEAHLKILDSMLSKKVM